MRHATTNRLYQRAACTGSALALLVFTTLGCSAGEPSPGKTESAASAGDGGANRDDGATAHPDAAGTASDEGASRSGGGDTEEGSQNEHPDEELDDYRPQPQPYSADPQRGGENGGGSQGGGGHGTPGGGGGGAPF